MARPRSAAALAALTAAAVLLPVGSAWAYWRTVGAGAGSGSTATARSAADLAAVTTSATTTAVLLYPGGTGDLAVAVRNGNSYPISVTALTPNAAGTTGCTTPAVTSQAPSSYTVGGTAVTLPRSIAPGATTTFTLVGALSMGASSNDCQGKTLSVPVTVGWEG